VKQIMSKWKGFKSAKENDERIYDEIDEFFTDLSRGELLLIMNYVEGQFKSPNNKYETALNEIRNIINCTDYSMAKYSKIKRICKRLNQDKS